VDGERPAKVFQFIFDSLFYLITWKRNSSYNLSQSF
jgi:hypothetical protein